MMKRADRMLLLIAGLISCLNAGILTWRAITEEFPRHLAIPAILAATGGIIWLWLSFGSRDYT
jgi:hypothetical protein